MKLAYLFPTSTPHHAPLLSCLRIGCCASSDRLLPFRVGCCVLLGLHVVASLASTGKYRVKGLVRNLEKAKEALSPSSGARADGDGSSGGGDGDDGLEIELAQGDILDEASLGAAMKVRYA